MIEALARRAVDRLLAAVEETAIGELPADVRVEREGERIALVGPKVRLRALTEGRIAGLFRAAVRR